MIDVGRLLALHAVSVYGTVTAAAESLHLTPSAVSQHLGKLERETRSTLVEKDGRRIRLTQAGRLMADHAARVVAELEQAEAALAAYHETVSGQLTIASFPTACRGLLPHALRQLVTAYPELATSVLEADRRVGLESLQRGLVDLALIDEWLEISVPFAPGIRHAELGHDVADLVVPVGHPLAASTDPISLTDLRDERWIAAAPGTVCHTWLLRMVPGVRPAVLVGEFATQLTFVAEGLGIAILPRLARTALPTSIVARPIAAGATRRVLVAWRGTAGSRPAIGAAVAALRDAWHVQAVDSTTDRSGRPR